MPLIENNNWYRGGYAGTGAQGVREYGHRGPAVNIGRTPTGYVAGAPSAIDTQPVAGGLTGAVNKQRSRLKGFQMPTSLSADAADDMDKATRPVSPVAPAAASRAATFGALGSARAGVPAQNMASPLFATNVRERGYPAGAISAASSLVSATTLNPDNLAGGRRGRFTTGRIAGMRAIGPG